jgi:AraC-like DNA-binding protein/quercetin dioxygenase-like cupin family protein
MPSGFEHVYKEVEKFKAGAYCASSVKEEINTPFHSHDKGQFIYTVKGTLHIDTETNHYFLPVEHFIWVPKNVTHRMWSNNSSFRMFTIYFDSDGEQAQFFDNTGVYMVNDLLHQMIAFARQWEGHICENDFAAHKFLQGFKAVLPQVTKAGSLPLLAFVRPHNQRLLDVMEYMRLNMEHKPDLKNTAQKFGFSERSLSRLFKSEGISFIEYLQAVRVMRSMELLAEKNLNVNMVGLKVGYESLTAFSNIFMRFTGVRPTDYTKNLKSNPPSHTPATVS